MTVSPDQTLKPLIRKLELWRTLDAEDRAALLALPYKKEEVAANRYIVREGDRPEHSCLLLSGFAFRHKVLADGARSILSVQMKGDVVDLQNSLLELADHSVQTLTRGEVAFIPREAVRQLAFARPNIGIAMWYDTLVDGSIFREWIANVSRRDAPSKLAHMLCEFGMRLESVGLGDRLSYELPMTQEQLADATGLTSVHVNRTLMELEARGLIARAKKFVAISDWKRLAAAGGFNDAYLHLPNGNSLLP
jgi:CRP-like cAMP-binding protein